MKIYKITEASEYLGVSINTLKTLANNGKVADPRITRKATSTIHEAHRIVKGLAPITDRRVLATTIALHRANLLLAIENKNLPYKVKTFTLNCITTIFREALK